MTSDIQTKAVVTVAEMARMVGLSRARFYQLQKVGIFPWPVYDVSTRRPIYVEELQKVCLEVRRRNCGVNGRPVLFYARNNLRTPVAKGRLKPRPNGKHIDLLDALKALGLVVSSTQVDASVKELFPLGTASVPAEEVIRAVFVRLKRRDTGDNVGR